MPMSPFSRARATGSAKVNRKRRHGAKPRAGGKKMSLPAFSSAVLEGYRALPDTPNRSSRSDRSLAERWFHQQIPLPQIQAAFALALLRRHLRSEGSPPLPLIRSLHYFVPLLEEVSQQDPLTLIFAVSRLATSSHKSLSCSFNLTPQAGSFQQSASC